MIRTIQCEDESISIKKITSKEYCFDLAKTECTESEETIPSEICVFDYKPKDITAQAKTVKVHFKKICEKQMVTVCDTNYPHGFQFPSFEAHCRELEQETCYNVPKVSTYVSLNVD